MPRQPRLDAPGTLHHVMVRGNERTALFRDDRDRTDFVARLATGVEAGGLDGLRLVTPPQPCASPGPDSAAALGVAPAESPHPVLQRASRRGHYSVMASPQNRSVAPLDIFVRRTIPSLIADAIARERLGVPRKLRELIRDLV